MNAIKNFIVVLFSILVSLLIGEIAVRFIKPQQTYSTLTKSIGSYFALSPYNTFTLKQNYSGEMPSNDTPKEVVKITTNSIGLRGPELDEREKILIIGDSYTFGFNVGDNNTFSSVLQRLEDANGKQFQVLNAGYACGFDADQQYVWLKHNIKRFKPRIVVYASFLGNDIIGINPSAWDGLDGSGLPERFINRGVYVDGSGVIRDTTYNPNSVGYQWWYKLPFLRNSHLYILAARSYETYSLTGSFIDKTKPYSSGYFQHLFGEYSQAFLEKEAIYLEIIKQMKLLAVENDADFYVALIPINFIIEKEKLNLVIPPFDTSDARSLYYSRIARIVSNQMGVRTINIESEMLRSFSGPFFPESGEVHYNSNGHRFTGERLFQAIHGGDYIQATESWLQDRVQE